jgi:hypothetical protein
MEQFLDQNAWALALLALWQIPWKGWALWRASHLDDKVWFIILLVVQTLGILDIIYIFLISRRKRAEGTVNNSGEPDQPTL